LARQSNYLLKFDMENTQDCASSNGADQVICALFGPDWKDVLLNKEGQVIQRCERCKQCQRVKPQE
jgi:hypothetical protein